ncbi:hypothetical protein, variant [Aphanomyces invadans]|nr:hypothetical protein, variant [Aphanomyces invadans]ETV94890.1 hypothetical protein, variant [Aphanomyces invadans]|eukprot:XP_008876481.1 hypothetical protein, variant [Aphanomyces invadans]
MDALKALMYYFDTLRFCLEAAVSVDFGCDVPGFDQCKIHCSSMVSPVERFLDAFKCPSNALAQANVDCNSFHVDCLAVAPYLDEVDLDGRCSIALHVMRFVNHVPLLPEKDIYVCAIIAAIQRSNWRSLGYKCVMSESIYAPLQLVPLTVNERMSSQESKHVVISVNMDTCGEPTRYSSLTKSALVEATYGEGVQNCMALMLDQLALLYPVLFERRANPSTELARNFAPLIVTSVSGILLNATFAGVDVTHFEAGNPLYGVQSRLELEHRVLDIMTTLL